MRASKQFCVSRACSSFPIKRSRCGRCAACSTEAGARFCASRQVPTKEDLQRLATEAGFADVEVRIDRIDIHLPRIAEFTLEHLAGSPVAQTIAAAPADARAKFAASVAKRLERYADGEGVTYPEETQVLTARVH